MMHGMAGSAALMILVLATIPSAIAGLIYIAVFGLGSIGGMLIATTVGLILQYTGSYFPIFLIAGSAYLVALAVIHLIVPQLEPANVD